MRFKSVRSCHTLTLYVLFYQGREKKRQAILPLDKLNFLAKYPKDPWHQKPQSKLLEISQERNKNNLVKLHIRFVKRRETLLPFTPYFNIHSKRKTYLKRGAMKTFFPPPNKRNERKWQWRQKSFEEVSIIKRSNLRKEKSKMLCFSSRELEKLSLIEKKYDVKDDSREIFTFFLVKARKSFASF